MDKIKTLIKHYGSRSELARKLKLNSAEVIRGWEMRGNIPAWRLVDVNKMYDRVARLKVK